LLVCFSVSLLRGSPRGAAIEVSCRVVSERLPLDFDAFYIEHHRCGEFDAGIENPLSFGSSADARRGSSGG
jgi:hypothetical protein